MKITFLGGTETVTGSKYLVETRNTRVLVDCGLYQGYKSLRQRNWQPLPTDIDKIDAVLLTHAHLDHSGYIPVLYKNGFRGSIFTHHASKDLSAILLADSGRIQEDDAKYYRKHKLSKLKNPLPLYDRAIAEKSMKLFNPVSFDHVFSVGDMDIHLQRSGHILGAASIIIKAEGKRIGFSGDVGRSNDIFMNPPQLLPEVDCLMLESTYGNRRHDQSDPYKQLEDVVNTTAHKGGVLLIPCFAVGRSQTVLHVLAELKRAQRIPPLPVYLDSPMAINVSDIYCRYSNEHRLSHEQCHEMCNVATYTRSVDDSKAIASQRLPHIILAGSGMATGGRILHHLKRLVSDHRTRVLFTGYQAGGTRGAKILDGVESIKIHGQWLPVRSDIDVIHGLSGHADYLGIGSWLKKSLLKEDTLIQLIHGDPNALESMRDYLRCTTKYSVDIAGYRSSIEL